MPFINRWLLSTNAKDIGTQYIIFAAISGLVGSSLSFIIRMELSAGGKVYLLGNYDQYNVIITYRGIVLGSPLYSSLLFDLLNETKKESLIFVKGFYI